MTKTPYLEKRIYAGGIRYYFVPPKAIRARGLMSVQALGPVTRTAEARAIQLAAVVKDHYKRIKEEQKIPVTPEEASTGTATVRDLIIQYMESGFYASLRRPAQYKSCFNTLHPLVYQGVPILDMPLVDVNKRVADWVCNQLLERSSDGRATKLQKATHCIRVFRRVWNIGQRWELVTSNPFEDMGLRKGQARTARFTPEQFQLAVKTALDMGYVDLSLLMRLMYATTQRKGDIIAMKWGQIQGTRADFTQSKTGSAVWVPISPELISDLRKNNRHNRDEDHVIPLHCTPLSSDRRFAKQFMRVKAACKLPSHLLLMDIRRTAATELAMAGATEDQIRACTGHKSRQVVSTYVRLASNMADDAMKLRWNKQPQEPAQEKPKWRSIKLKYTRKT